MKYFVTDTFCDFKTREVSMEELQQILAKDEITLELFSVDSEKTEYVTRPY